MNPPTAECNCSCATGCDSCMPACEPRCSTAPPPFRKIKAEMPFKKEKVCTVENCKIFGGHDTDIMPDYQCRVRPNKSRNTNKNTLGTPIGVSASTVNFGVTGKASEIIKARFATYLKAFARLYLNSELVWDSALIDDIMKEGLLLYSMSENEKNDMESPLEIYTTIESSILRKFELSGFTFHIELMSKFQFTPATSADTGAKGDGGTATLPLTVEYVKPALKEFFREKKYCLLSVNAFYLMIWRSKEAYFVFDSCGRRLTDFKTDKDQGVAMLVCLSTLENVRYLVAGLSNLNHNDKLNIREIKVVNVVTPDGSLLQRDYLIRTHKYEIINEDYAYLKASYHLTLNKNDLLRNRSSLPVAIAALTGSKIDHPATWDMKMADKIICYGVTLCQNYWGKCNTSDTIDVKEFPTFFKMGQFHITTDVVDRKYEGIWRCVPGFKHSELGHYISKAFETGNYKLVVQINYQMYAIWKKNDFIYLFDPYRHRILGKPNESEVYEEMEKSATVRMFRSFDVFMNVFNHILLDSNRTSNFSIHVLKVLGIQISYKHEEGVVKFTDAAKQDAAGEVMSINEHICFEENEVICDKALAEISDYEDDDLKSDVFEMELRTSSSEAEVVEEEETGLGAIEELEGLESSSSGEEGHHKKKDGNSKGGVKGKGGKGKSGKKQGGGGGKGKKGKGTDDNEVGNNKKRKGDEISEDEANRAKKIKGDEEVGASDKKGGGKDVNKALGKDGDRGLGKDIDKGGLGKDGDKGGLGKDGGTSGLGKDGDKSGLSTDGTKGGFGKDGEKGGLGIDGKKGGLGKDSEKGGLGKDGNKGMGKDGDKGLGTHGDKGGLGKDGHTGLGKDDGKGIFGKDDRDKQKDKENRDKLLKEKDKNKKDTDKHAKNKDKGKIDDGAEADDENEDFFKKSHDYCFPNPNRYPGYLPYPVDMAVVGSETGSYASLCKLFQAGFKIADRILVMTSWGNFVIFRCKSLDCSERKYYFLYSGCTHNYNRFRHLDLSIGTAGLISFEHIHNLIEYIRRLRKSRRRVEEKYTADEICKQYCNRNFDMRL